VISGARGDQISCEVRPGLQKSRQRRRQSSDCADRVQGILFQACRSEFEACIY
jgi:hypothetical protein